MSDRSVNGIEHPDHGEIVEDTLDTRVHDNEPVYFCTRCRNYVPKDEPEQFDEIDCDRYKKVSENITEGF